MDDTHGQFYLNLHVEDGPGVLAEIADHFGAQRRLDRAGVAGGVRRRGHARVHHAPHAGERVPEDAAAAPGPSGGSRDLERPARGRRGGMTAEGSHQWRGVIEEYRDRLPVTDATPVVTLREGGTPLVAVRPALRRDRLRRLAEVRGSQPHGFVQGPRDDARDQQGDGGRREGRRLRVHRQHSASAAAYAAKAGITCAVLVPKGKIALGQDGADARARRARPGGRRELRRRARAGEGPRRALPRHAGELRQPVPAAGTEDRGVRDLRSPRPRARHPLRPGRERGQHLEPLAGVLRVPARRR